MMNRSYSETLKTEINIKQYISEEKDVILDFIEKNRRVLLNASPGSGKTTFFANLCISQIQNNKQGRIIFCSPFLIIQSQFKIELAKKGVKIDLELNSVSPRKNLNHEDRIITSTYHSLKLIADDLNSKDLIIIDEAHSLLYNYKKENSRQFFVSTFQVLVKTEAKIIAMSGTPYQGVKFVLGLNELKIIKLNEKSQINIQYSKDSAANHVLRFAEECLEKFPHDHLNIIYIKNKKACEKFKYLLESKFECKSFVLSASRKDNEVYESLVIDSSIPEDIQFLITTNIISTGANILNNKIGRALMLHEHNPVEIKQFSKRFRKKMNIEVDVVNRSYQKTEFSPQVLREEITLERNHQRLFFSLVLPRLLDANKRFEDLFRSKSTFYNKDADGTPSHLLDSLVKRMVIQESFFIEELNKTYNDPSQLELGLQEYDDVMPVYVPTKYNFEYSGKEEEEIEFDLLLKMNSEEVINHTIQNYEKLLLNLYAYYKNTGNSYYPMKIRTLLKGEFDINAVPKTIGVQYSKLFRETDFISDIFLELIEVNAYIRNIPKSLYFLKSTIKNKRKSVLISFFTNDFFREYFEVKMVPSSYHPIITFKEDVNMELLLKDKRRHSVSRFISFAFDYCIRQEYINLEKFKTFFKAHFTHRIEKLEDPILNEMDVDPEGKISDLNNNLLLGVIQGLFYMKTNPQDRKEGNKRISSYLFHSTFPKIKENMSLLEKSDILQAHEECDALEFLGSTKTYGKLKWQKEKTRILNSHSLLSYSVVDKKFYLLLEKKAD